MNVIRTFGTLQEARDYRHEHGCLADLQPDEDPSICDVEA